MPELNVFRDFHDMTDEQLIEALRDLDDPLRVEIERLHSRVMELETALKKTRCTCRWSYDHAASIWVKCPRCSALNL